MASSRSRAQSADERRDIVLRLLDHQIVGPENQMLGNIDDLVLDRREDPWLVTGLMVGPPALANRLPGRLGTWTRAIWRRLRPDADPPALVIPMTAITRIGSAVTVDEAAARGLEGAFGLELWLRSFVISRIPGAKGGGQDNESGGGSRRAQALVERAPDNPDTVSHLVGARVITQTGSELGRVTELRCLGPKAGGRQRSLRVTQLEYGRHTAGSELGYSADPAQGPLLLARAIRWWQRDTRVAPLADVLAVDPDAGTVTITRESSHVHPHEA